MHTYAKLAFFPDNMPAPKWIGGDTEALNQQDRYLCSPLPAIPVLLKKT